MFKSIVWFYQTCLEQKLDTEIIKNMTIKLISKKSRQQNALSFMIFPISNKLVIGVAYVWPCFY